MMVDDDDTDDDADDGDVDDDDVQTSIIFHYLSGHGLRP